MSYEGNKLENKIVIAVKGIVLYNNKALIIKRDSSDEVGAGTWEFAGGKIEFGEDLEHALIREVKEEAGIDIVVEKLLYAATFKSDPTRQVVILTYKCQAMDDKVKLSEEHSAYAWASKEKLREVLFPAIVKDMDRYNIFPLIFGK